MTFRQFLCLLAEQIGHHQIPVRETAVDIHGFLGPEGVHHDLIKRTVRSLYRANRCGHLDARVQPGPCMDVLYALRQELLLGGIADVDQVRLAEELCDRAAEGLEFRPALVAHRHTAQVIVLRRAPAFTHAEPDHAPGQEWQSGGDQPG